MKRRERPFIPRASLARPVGKRKRGLAKECAEMNEQRWKELELKSTLLYRDRDFDGFCTQLA